MYGITSVTFKKNEIHNYLIYIIFTLGRKIFPNRPRHRDGQRVTDKATRPGH